MHTSSRAVGRRSPLVPAVAATGLFTLVLLSSAVAATAKPTITQTMDGHLTAGEFGPALQLANKVLNPQEKTRLLKRIADAQMKAGATRSAIRTLRSIPVAEERQAAGRKQIRRWASAAGGSGANFGELINLIQNETSGVWSDADGDPDGGGITQFESGIRVDPNGLLTRLTRTELTNRLKTLGIRARNADLNKEMARPSGLRLVSLTRLEQEIRRRMAEGKPVVETMKNLAGLYKIEYIFVFPENGEIVIGGPAAGWRYNEKGQPLAMDTGKPTLQLDDFVTVLRTFSTKGNNFFNCLIVPRKSGLKQARAVAEASQKRGPLSPAGTRAFVNRLRKALGQQDVVVNGIPRDSRVARVIVEADYRMKLIGINRVRAGSKIPSYFQLLARHPQKSQPALDALRWWLTMKYDAIVHSKNRNVFHIEGSSVLCQGVNEKITSDGRRIQTGKADPVNRMFASNFTAHYGELAKRDLIFADLQNVFDLSLVAALIHHEKLAQKAGWNSGVFAVDGKYRPASYEPIKTVMSVSNHRVYRGGSVVIQVAGGVRADLMSVVRNKKLRKTAPRLGSMLASAKAPKLPQGRWWWDVKTDAN